MPNTQQPDAARLSQFTAGNKPTVPESVLVPRESQPVVVSFRCSPGVRRDLKVEAAKRVVPLQALLLGVVTEWLGKAWAQRTKEAT